ncbi:hypothetical protein GR7B_00212 [Vibrio phage vB_VcorM_GR7B]|nr:hypothetical protein GR7B_00212 [Vibrio phage vB_VcorM_GR7B]
MFKQGKVYIALSTEHNGVHPVYLSSIEGDTLNWRLWNRQFEFTTQVGEQMTSINDREEDPTSMELFITPVEVRDFHSIKDIRNFLRPLFQCPNMTRWIKGQGFLYHTCFGEPQWTARLLSITPKGGDVRVYGQYGSHLEKEWNMLHCLYAFNKGEYNTREKWWGKGYRVLELPSGDYDYSPHDEHLIK